MPGLLYPAYQKFYSALSSLDRFRKESNFFDNISCLDTFFSEYRNVTFAIQSQLKPAGYFNEYEKYRDKYLTDHWFIDKRNETTKQQPFQLQKKIVIQIYTPSEEFVIAERQFTAEDDTPFDLLKGEMKDFFNRVPSEEIFFSAVYSFSEKNSDTDLFCKLLDGISAMNNLLEALNNVIHEECLLCEQIKKRIKGITFPNVPRDFLLTDDYVYYRNNNEFEKAGRLAMLMSIDGDKLISRRPLEDMTEANYLNFDGTAFGRFALIHAVLKSVDQKADIMPAIMIIYSDNTYDMDVFHADIKTTVYRKLNETAKVIELEDVKEVCFMSLYSVICMENETPVLSEEQNRPTVTDILVVSSVDSELKEKEYIFEGKLMADPRYVADIMKNGLQTSLNVSRMNLLPILKAFRRKKNKPID